MVRHSERDTGRTSLRALVEQHREEIRAAAARHHGRRVRLYGSVARGQERRGSDVVSLGGLKARDQAILDEAIDL